MTGAAADRSSSSATAGPDEIDLGRRPDHSAAPLIARLAQVGL
jgi:hypothetical protein